PTPDPATLASFDADEAGVCLALASHSRHPLSRALANALMAAGHRAASLTDVEELPGTGVFARWHGTPVALRRPESATGISSALEIGERPVRLISYSDRLRPDTREALEGRKSAG